MRIGDLIYSADVVGEDLATGRVPTRLDEQFDLAFRNMKELVEEAGAGTENVAQVTFYLRNLTDRAAINRPWLAMFPDEHDRPTYKFMQSDLAGQRLVQLQVFAVASARRQLLNIPGIGHGNPIPMGVKIGKYVFTSRILPADPSTGKNGEGPEQQTMFAFHNLSSGRPEDVTETWIFLKDAATAQQSTSCGPRRSRCSDPFATTCGGFTRKPARHGRVPGCALMTTSRSFQAAREESTIREPKDFSSLRSSADFR